MYQRLLASRPSPDQSDPQSDLQAAKVEEEGTEGKAMAAEEEEGAEEKGVEAKVHSYLLEAFASGTEGLMLKALDTKASYQASKRSESWLKLKK